MNPVNGTTETIDFERKLIVRKVIKEGAKPSLEQINKWFQNGLTINVIKEEEEIKGRITCINPIDSSTDALLEVENHLFRIYVRNIKHFKVEETEEVPFPLVLDPNSELATKIPTVRLVSEGEMFLVNQEKLCQEVPYFKVMLQSGLKESIALEMDVTASMSSEQLKLIFQFIEWELQINASNCIELFILSNTLMIDRLNSTVKEYLIRNLTRDEIDFLKSNPDNPYLLEFLEDINNQIRTLYNKEPLSVVVQELYRLLKGGNSLKNVTEFNFECRKYSYSRRGPYDASPYLKSEGIIDLSRIIEIFGGTIESVTISKVNDSDLPPLVEYLKENPQIQSLTINWGTLQNAYEGLTDKVAYLLAETIRALPLLRTLKIRDSRIGDEGIKQIADAIETHTSIEVLDFGCSHIASRGFSYLTEKLVDNKFVTFLRLTACAIGVKLKSDGGYVQALSRNMTLKVLYIENNAIDDEGAAGIAKIIESNTSLEEIYMGRNSITIEGRKKIVAALLNNNTLKDVEINTVQGEPGDSIYLRGSELSQASRYFNSFSILNSQ